MPEAKTRNKTLPFVSHSSGSLKASSPWSFDDLVLEFLLGRGHNEHDLPEQFDLFR
jgi:hypothetical protein